MISLWVIILCIFCVKSGLATTARLYSQPTEGPGPLTIDWIKFYCNRFATFYAETDHYLYKTFTVSGCGMDLQSILGDVSNEGSMLEMLSDSCVLSNANHLECARLLKIFKTYCWNTPQAVLAMHQIRRTRLTDALSVMSEAAHFMLFQDWLKYRDVKGLNAILCVLEFSMAKNQEQNVKNLITLERYKAWSAEENMTKCSCSEVLFIEVLFPYVSREFNEELEKEKYMSMCSIKRGKFVNWTPVQIKVMRHVAHFITHNTSEIKSSKFAIGANMAKYDWLGFSLRVATGNSLDWPMTLLLVSSITTQYIKADRVAGLLAGFELEHFTILDELQSFDELCRAHLIIEVLNDSRDRQRRIYEISEPNTQKFWHNDVAEYLHFLRQFELMHRNTAYHYSKCSELVSIVSKIQKLYYQQIAWNPRIFRSLLAIGIVNKIKPDEFLLCLKLISSIENALKRYENKNGYSRKYQKRLPIFRKLLMRREQKFRCFSPAAFYTEDYGKSKMIFYDTINSP